MTWLGWNANADPSSAGASAVDRARGVAVRQLQLRGQAAPLRLVRRLGERGAGGLEVAEPDQRAQPPLPQDAGEEVRRPQRVGDALALPERLEPRPRTRRAPARACRGSGSRPTLAAGSGASAMIGPARAQELLRLLELPALERARAARLTLVTPTIGSADQPSRSAIAIASRRCASAASSRGSGCRRCRAW